MSLEESVVVSMTESHFKNITSVYDRSGLFDMIENSNVSISNSDFTQISALQAALFNVESGSYLM